MPEVYFLYKLDDLKLLCLSHSPDIICITETWLSPVILNSEIKFHGYTLLRLDRDHHGGGVAMMISSSLSPSLVSLPSNSTELLLSSITHHKHRLFIGTFYCPPSSNTAIASLSSVLSNLSSYILSNLILVGDFNVNYTSSSTSPLFLVLKSLAESYSLSQVISDPTHFSHAGTPSIIDLTFIPSTFHSSHSILPPVSSSDIMQFLSQFLFLFVFLALTNPPAVASGSTTELT